jgi:flavorubredoxin
MSDATPVIETSKQTAPALNALVPGRLYAISSTVPLDGTVSWAPNLPGRFQPVNCYLAREGTRVLLVDTGVAAHSQRTVEALRQVVPDGSALSVVLTRAEMDCVSGLEAIGHEFPIDQLLAGGAANPFDAFQEAGRALGTQELVALEQPDAEGLVLARTRAIDLGADRRFEIVTPMLRLLATFWIRDFATGALFTSDMFGHTDVPHPDSSPVIDRIDDGPGVTPLAEHLLAKHWWLRKANRSRLADAMEELMAELDPTIIAPGHGCILVGRDVVRHHVGLLLQTLRATPAGVPV